MENFSNGRLLVLDDEPLIGSVLMLMAEELKIESMSVSNSDSFFKALDSLKPSHIILDLIMPEMDGVEVLNQLGMQGCKARIAISSGVGSRIMAAAHISAYEHGLDIAGLLSKPIRLETLREFLYCDPSLHPSIPDVKPAEELGNAPITSSDIRKAIQSEHFRLDYQPKVNCVSRRVTGFEALIRWDCPIKGLIMPDRFIQLSEELGLIGLITDQVVDNALNWHQSMAEIDKLSISINLSANSLQDLDLANWLEKMCDQAGIKKELVVLEITETAALGDQLLALDIFTRLRMKGFGVWIDDFGVGNSSLRVLARLPFSGIQLDKSFAMTATTSQESRIIIKSTVELSHSLGLLVIAEGVEDRETLDFLQEIGCDHAQGYYISRPMSGSTAADWMGGYHDRLDMAVSG